MNCKGCGDEIAGFDVDGYCEACLCDECGTTLGTEEEQAWELCNDCLCTADMKD